ncbi:Protein DD3-3 [Holothuria leucospilota]|uniref:Protein DD3-3 n=1 Tax=Holothuria leucospilota TaxID=206669 RepID=A0A9Q1CLR1_HOLLE|nr:Protein DD3-3 [Holothuria leucospilota]
MKAVAVLSLLVLAVNGDLYMHNPRGSNNRLDEAGRERNNGNRMFDSQNNNRGGYNVGGLYYYTDSMLQIEWTNQHSCGNPNNHCELIIQYMCGDLVRDGSVTSTIPENPSNCYNYNCNTDMRFGMHENFDYYLNCKLRARNQGLFTADQNLNRDTARSTRQNPQGTRRGYECPEERDYYPYWHPSPWVDIAIMTNDATRCPYYQAESQNVKSRFYCQVPNQLLLDNILSNKPYIPITQEECEALVYPEGAANGTKGVWTEAKAHGVAAPDCREAHFSRDNHLGNGLNGFPNVYNWTIPDDFTHERCALRMRYNISTGEYDGFDGSINAELNAENRNQPTKLDLSQRFGLTPEEAEERGYVFEGNPQVEIFTGDNSNGNTFQLQLAINTAQYGRTFQDRSHTFAIRKRPAELVNQTIHNLNVRGKRGNIVQVYPAVEYDFVPNTLIMQPEEYVHMQWTGSNTNPRNNDGQGLAGTDRSNVVLIAEQVYPEGSDAYHSPYTKNGHWGSNYPMRLSDSTFLGLGREDLINLAINRPNQFRGELSELDDAGTYFDAKPLKVTETGHYHYMCTRNNNFSNRSQKGRIICSNEVQLYKAIGWTGGTITSENSEVVFEQGTLNQLYDIKLEEWETDQAENEIRDIGGTAEIPGEMYLSKFIVLYPTESFTANDTTFRLMIKVSDDASNTEVYHSFPETFATWTKMDYSMEGGKVHLDVSQGGAYIVRGHKSIGAIVGIVVASVVVVLLVVGIVAFFVLNPDKWTGLKSALTPSNKV